jgi:hypothetical protein
LVLTSGRQRTGLDVELDSREKGCGTASPSRVAFEAEGGTGSGLLVGKTAPAVGHIF